MTYDDIDADVRAFVDKVENFFPDNSAQADAAEQRRRYDALCHAFDRQRPAGVAVEDRRIAGRDGPIPIRIYRPLSGGDACLIYFHGGGWVVGGLDSHDGVCAEIAEQCNVTVVAVDYRLAPEHMYPAAHDDCWDALTALADDANTIGIDDQRIGIGGDSAGANMAAGLAIRARDRGGPAIKAQFLIYGAFGGDWSLPSYTEHAHAPLLTTADMKAYALLYFGEERRAADDLASPLNCDDLSGLSPAFLQPSGLDPLRDDSVEYARRLEAAGVYVELSVEHGLPHGSLRARHSTDAGRAAFGRLCDAVVRML